MYKISVVPGDGIGPEIMDEEIKILEADGDNLGIKYDWEYFPYGADHYLKTGVVLDEDGLKGMEKTKAIFLVLSATRG